AKGVIYQLIYAPGAVAAPGPSEGFQKRMGSPRFELGIFSMSRRCPNQLDHEPGIDPWGPSRAKRFPYFMVVDLAFGVSTGGIARPRLSNPLYPSRAWHGPSIPMPSKAMCPQCGQKIRGAS